MTDEQLAERFEQHRAHLQRVAYSMLGSVSEAEDQVQEAWLRLSRQPDPARIRDLRAWLTMVVSRLSLDALGSARLRREQYVGPWLPEPLVTRAQISQGAALGGGASDPADLAAIDESVSTALMILLETLSPPERIAFLLHDVFGFTFEQTAQVTGGTAAAARKLAERARKHVEAGRPRFPPTRSEQLAVVQAFASACNEGDIQGLLAVLDPVVVWRADGGGRVNAARQIHEGAEKVARAMLALARRPLRGGYLAEINGAPGLVTEDEQGHVSVISFTLDNGLIVAIDIVRNPDKLARVPPPPTPTGL